jgi:DNA polymerase-3 subunit beta
MLYSTQLSVGQIRAALLFAADRDVRYYLNGVCIEHSPQGERAIATDGHRLICVNIDVSDRIRASAVHRFIVPRETLENVLKVHDKNLAVVITYNTETKKVQVGQLSADAVDGTFPEYERVVPDKLSGEVAQFNWRYLADCIKARSLLTTRKMTDPAVNVGIAHNGNRPAWVSLSEDAFAIVMPMSADDVATAPPSWFRAPAKEEEKAAA